MTTTTTTDAARDIDQALHALCEQWASWVYTRRYYAPPPLAAGILAKLSAKTRAPAQPGGPDAANSAELWALNRVISGYDMSEERICFELFYRYRVRNIKATAHELGITRQTFYNRMTRFRRLVVSQAMRSAEEEKGHAAHLAQQHEAVAA
jgi:hypothetical protein